MWCPRRIVLIYDHFTQNHNCLDKVILSCSSCLNIEKIILNLGQTIQNCHQSLDSQWDSSHVFPNALFLCSTLSDYKVRVTGWAMVCAWLLIPLVTPSGLLLSNTIRGLINLWQIKNKKWHFNMKFIEYYHSKCVFYIGVNKIKHWNIWVTSDSAKNISLYW